MAEGIAVPLITPFGQIVYDFANESSCHMLIGGSTWMGKTVFLRLIGTHIMLATDGKCDIYFMDNKINDLWMFKDIPQIQIAETLDEANSMIVLGVPDAAHLGRIQGGAVLMDKVQVPYLPDNTAAKLLDKYRRNNNVKRERQSDNHVPENIPGNESRSDWFDHLS